MLSCTSAYRQENLLDRKIDRQVSNHDMKSINIVMIITRSISSNGPKFLNGFGFKFVCCPPSPTRLKTENIDADEEKNVIEVEMRGEFHDEKW